jgi:hypothetical protein
MRQGTLSVWELSGYICEKKTHSNEKLTGPSGAVNK